jgi:hypothetical protein
MHDDTTTKELLTPEEAAEFLHVAVATLATWRSRKEREGPAYRKHGRKVVYHIDDLRRWSKKQVQA